MAVCALMKAINSLQACQKTGLPVVSAFEPDLLATSAACSAALGDGGSPIGAEPKGTFHKKLPPGVMLETPRNWKAP